MSEAATPWAAARPAGLEFNLVSDIDGLVEQSTIVIIGRPIGVGSSIELGGDPDNNEVRVAHSVIVEVDEVLSTRSRALGLQDVSVGSRIEVIIHREPTISKNKAPVMLFLRQAGDDRYYYQLPPDEAPSEHREAYRRQLETWEKFRVGKFELWSSQTVLVGNSDTTINPLRHPEDDPLAEQITDVSIEEIAARVRAVAP